MSVFLPGVAWRCCRVPVGGVAILTCLGLAGCAHAPSTKPESAVVRSAGPSSEALRRQLPGEWLLQLAQDTPPDRLRLKLASDGMFTVRELWLLAEIPGGRGTWEVDDSKLVLLLRDYPHRSQADSGETKRLVFKVSYIGERSFRFQDGQGRWCSARRVLPKASSASEPGLGMEAAGAESQKP